MRRQRPAAKGKKQMRTLNRELAFSGVGLHSGSECSVRLLPSQKDGIYFNTRNGSFSAASAVVEEDSRLTGFRLPDGTHVRTAEHLLGAIVGMGLDSVEVELGSEEIPILDGSALPFASAIAEAGLCDNGTEKTRRALFAPIAVEEPRGGRVMAAIPSDTIKITYVIDYSGTPIGVQRASYEITPETFLNTIAKARTFGLTNELDFLRQNGLAKGGSLDNAVMFDKDRLLNPGGLRFPLEPVTHKVIDLLGDLALMGNVPIAHYTAICAGHGIHGKLVDKLKKIFM